jgi:cytochrome P450
MTLTTDELQGLALFEGCAEGDRRAVAVALRGERALLEGETLCTEGDKADHWWIVIDGLADVTVSGLYTATIGPGETIGELALLDGEPRGATVTAVTPMRLHEIDGDAFLDALLSSPRLSVALLRQLAARLRATNRRPASAARRPPTLPVDRTSTPVPPPAPTQLDPAAPGFFDDPAIALAELREAAPLHWSDVLSSWLVTRYEDVHRLTRSRSVIGSVTTLGLPVGPGPDGSMPKPKPGHRMMINRDGEDHLRLRRLVSKVFTPRAVGQWQQRASTIVDQLLAEASGRGELDIIADYALPLPAQVITEMLGLPRDDTPQLRAWSRALTNTLEPDNAADEKEKITEAGRAMGDYLQQVIADKRRSPGDDILSGLLHAEDAGDILDDKEVLAQVVMLYIAGHETTLNLIGNGVTHLLSFPDQLELLRTEPALDANAVEEVLRYESPAQLTRRINLEPIEVGEVTIPAGSHITLSLASANRDPRKWGPTADVLDIARPGANEHVSFGGGAHYCLGASLARFEAKIALPRLIRRFPAMAPAYDKPQWIRRLALRGVETLPVTL